MKAKVQSPVRELELLDDQEVRRAVAFGSLTRFEGFGDPPIDQRMLEQMRERLRRHAVPKRTQ